MSSSSGAAKIEVAPAGVVGKVLACYYRQELATGQTRRGAPLTPEDRAMRISALRARAATLHARYKKELLDEMDKIEQGVEELKKQSAEQHTEAMKEFDGLHAKVDGMAGNLKVMEKVAALLTENTPPKMCEGQTWAERQLELQNRKRAFDIELAVVRMKAAEEKKAESQQSRLEVGLMQQQLLGVNLEELPVEAARAALGDLKKANRAKEQALEVDIRKRRAQETKEAKMAAKKARTEGAVETGGAVPPGDGHGGFRKSAIRSAPHFVRNSRPGLGRRRIGTAFGGMSLPCAAPHLMPPSLGRELCTRCAAGCIVDF
jgi:hypothetical protein